MRVDDEMKYQIGLLLIDAVGDIIAKKLLIHFGTAKAVSYAKKKELEKIEGIGEYLINSILSTDALKRAQQELKLIEQKANKK